MNRVLLCVISFASLIGVAWGQQPADTVFYNGKVLTVDRQFSVAGGVAVRGGRIAAVGSSDDVLKLAGPNTVKIDLKGKTVVPGLINTHSHPDSPEGYEADLPPLRRKSYPLNFRLVKTKDDVLKQIREIIAAFKIPPGQWIFFPINPRGNQAQLVLDQMNAAELDKAAPNNPIVMGTGMPPRNINMASGKALELLWKKYGNFIETYGRYWIDSSGKPSGILEAPASRIVWEDPEFALLPAAEDAGPMYRKLWEEQAALGVTTVSGAINSTTAEAYHWLDSRGEMPVRYAYGAMAAFGPGSDLNKFKIGSGSDVVWVNSVSARAVDGAGARMCISVPRDSKAAGVVEAAGGGETSLMGLSSSADWWPRGQCSLDIEYNGGTRGARIKGNYFKEWFGEVGRLGLRSANVHVGGNDSYSRFLSVMEEVDRAKPGAVKGWAMDHGREIDPRDIPRIAKLGVMISCKAGNVDSGPENAAAFGEHVANTYFEPIKAMVDAGINVSLETEGAGVYWDTIEAAITRKDAEGKVWGPDQKVDRITALRLATQNGANYVLKGDKLGSLEPGKFADLVVIDRDYMAIPEEEIGEIRPLATMLGGKFVFLRTDFSGEQGLKPAGATISTYQELRKRRRSSTPGEAG